MKVSEIAVQQLRDDLLYVESDSKLTCLTSLCTDQQSRRVHLHDQAQKNEISFFSARIPRTRPTEYSM
jgi:hypothetical protein